MSSGWYNSEELSTFGFANLGKNILISKSVSIYGAKNISLGNNVRIDDFSILACENGRLSIEGYNHIGAYSYINSAGNVVLKLFSGLSSRCSIYSSSEEYDGSFLTNPTIPKKYLKLKKMPITIGKHSVIGTNSTVLPGCDIEDYCSVGAFSLVNRPIPFGKMAKGIPAKVYKDRNVENLKHLEKQLLEENNG